MSSSGLPSTSNRSASAHDFDDTEFARIGIDVSGERHQIAIVGGRHLERFGGRVPADHHGKILPLPAGSPRIAQISAPQPVLTLYFFGLRSREHFQRRHSAGGQSGGSLLGSQFQRSMLRQTLLAKSD